MSAPRLLAAGLSFAACTLYWLIRKARAADAIRRNEGMLSDINELSKAISVDSVPLDAIAERLSREGECAEFWENTARGLSLGLTFSQSAREALVLFKDDGSGKTLEELFSRLGTGDISLETARLERAVSELEAICSRMRAEAGQRDRLTRSLSIMAGLALALLML